MVVEITQVGDTCQEVQRFQRNIASAVRMAELCVPVHQRVASYRTDTLTLVERVYNTLTVRLNLSIVSSKVTDLLLKDDGHQRVDDEVPRQIRYFQSCLLWN